MDTGITEILTRRVTTRRPGSWRRLGALLVLLAAGQAALAASEEEEGPAEKDERLSVEERLDALLTEVLPAEEYRETTRCLSRYDYRSVEVLSEEYLLFWKGSSYWLNKLKRRCPSLKFSDLPVFEQRGTTRLCESTPFYPTNRADLSRGLDGSGRPYAAQGTCFLGVFEEVSAEQAALLRGR